MPKQLTPAERAFRAISEKDFQKQVIQLAEMYGWSWCHLQDSRKMVRKGDVTFLVGDAGAKGWPDLVLVRAPEILFWEMKKELGKTTPEQDEWLSRLTQCGLEARVVRPSDFDEYAAPRLKRREF